LKDLFSRVRKGVAIVLALFLLGGMLALPAGTVAADSVVTVAVSPAAQTVSPGDTFTVDITIDLPSANELVLTGEGDDVTRENVTTKGFQFSLSFDPSLMECQGITEGPYYEDWADTNGAMSMTTPMDLEDAIDNTAGIIEQASIAVLGGPDDGVNGSGVAFAVEFEAKEGDGSVASLEISDVVVSDSSGQWTIRDVTVQSGTVNISDAEPSDLVVSEMSQEWVEEGDTYTVSYTIKNQGTGDAPATDTAILIDGVLVSTETCPSLSSGETDSKTVGPFDLSEYSDDIEIVADNDNVAGESDESNNARESTWSVALEPDLVVSSLEKEWVAAGSTYKITCTITNQGTGNATATSTAVNINSVEETSVACPALAPEESDTQTLGPFTISAEGDVVDVVADAESEITESDETNNSRQITVQAAGEEDASSTPGATQNDGSAAPASGESPGGVSPGTAAPGPEVTVTVEEQQPVNSTAAVVQYPPAQLPSRGLVLPWELVGGVAGAFIIGGLVAVTLRLSDGR
jgi:hypothetical protein